MAHTLLKPAFSFVQFDAPAPLTPFCDDGSVFFMPVVLDSDYAFQLTVTYDTIANADATMAAANTTLQLLMLKGVGNTAATVAANTVRNWTVQDGFLFNRYRTGPKQITFTWENGFPNFITHLATNTCFQIAITGQLEAGAAAQTLFSNEFKRSTDTCYTSVVAYSSEYDYAGFIYCNVPDYSNRARLPFYLSQPKTVEEKSVYRKSTGTIRRTKSLIGKEYKGQTDYLPDYMHDRLKIAFAHDIVSIESDSYTGVISESDYEPKYEEGNECTAQAEFKAVAQAFYVRRNNCNTC